MKNDIPHFDTAIQILFDVFNGIPHVETFYHIARVESYEPIGNGELAKMMHVSRSTITNRINVLLRQGLIISIPDPEHRSRHLLTLTPEGKKLKAKLIREIRNTSTAKKLADIMRINGITAMEVEAETARLKHSKKGEDSDES